MPSMLPMLIAALSAAPQLSQPWKDLAPGVQSAAAAELGGDPAWAARVVLIDPTRASFLVRYGLDFAARLEQELSLDSKEHQVIEL